MHHQAIPLFWLQEIVHKHSVPLLYTGTSSKFYPIKECAFHYPSGQFPHSGLLVPNASIVSPVHNILAEHCGDQSADLISLAAITLPSLTAKANQLNSRPCMSSVLSHFMDLFLTLQPNLLLYI